MPSPEKNKASAAENGEKPNSERSCDRNPKLVEGFSSNDQKAHGDALKRERAHQERSWQGGGCGARSGTAGSTTKDRKLQGTRGAEVRQNGKEVNQGVERNHAEGAYPRDTHGRASSSSAEKRRSELNGRERAR